MRVQFLIWVCFLIIFGCQSKVVFESENLKIIPVSEKTWMHISYLKTENFGLVPCNGLIYINENEAAVFDTPVDSIAAKELINWIEKKEAKIKAIVVNHFHIDCLGSLEVFHEKEIDSYASTKTKRLAKKNKIKVPKIGFKKSKSFKIGGKYVVNEYFGEAHTKDNIISWIAEEKVLFGGCMIKAFGAGEGNLKDANVKKWGKTVEKVMEKYGVAKFVVPGHGDLGSTELFDYTIDLFRE